MKDNFETCLALTLKHEGGFVNHPQDPGGATNLGITQRTYEQWVGYPVTVDDMKALTVNRVAPIYRRGYWDAVDADNLPAGMDYAVFDAAVNSGPIRALRWQMNAGGNGTDADVLRFIEAYCSKRLEFVQSLSTFNTFGKGWTRRILSVKADALKMASAARQQRAAA